MFVWNHIHNCSFMFTVQCWILQNPSLLCSWMGKKSTKRNTVRTTEEIIDASISLLPCQGEIIGILKFCSDFNEYVDTDVNSHIEHLIRFQIQIKSVKSDIDDTAGSCSTDRQVCTLWYLIDTTSICSIPFYPNYLFFPANTFRICPAQC